MSEVVFNSMDDMIEFCNKSYSSNKSFTTGCNIAIMYYPNEIIKVLKNNSAPTIHDLTIIQEISKYRYTDDDRYNLKELHQQILKIYKDKK